jgi:hypothetical protein
MGKDLSRKKMNPNQQNSHGAGEEGKVHLFIT